MRGNVRFLGRFVPSGSKDGSIKSKLSSSDSGGAVSFMSGLFSTSCSSVGSDGFSSFSSTFKGTVRLSSTGFSSKCAGYSFTGDGRSGGDRPDFANGSSGCSSSRCGQGVTSTTLGRRRCLQGGNSIGKTRTTRGLTVGRVNEVGGWG